MCACEAVCVHACAHVCPWVYVRTHVCACMYLFACGAVCTCTCVSTCVLCEHCMRVHTCAMPACVCTCVWCVCVGSVSSPPSFFPAPKLRVSGSRSPGERLVEPHISEKLYLLGHLASPGREGKWKSAPNHLKGRPTTQSREGCVPCAQSIHRTGPWPCSGPSALLWRLHREGLEQRGPCLQKQGPCGPCLGNPAWSGILLCPRDCSFRNQGPKNSDEDRSPAKKRGCWRRSNRMLSVQEALGTARASGRSACLLSGDPASPFS